MTETCPHHSGIVAQFNAICTKLELIEKHIQQQIVMAKEQVELAKADMDRRLETMNEFRTQLSQQAATFVSKTEVGLQFEKLENHVDVLARSNRDRIDLLEKVYIEKSAGKRWTDHIVTVLIGMAVLVAIWIMQHGIK